MLTKTELFIELAQPDSNGVSRWVSVLEFKEKYAALSIGNGLSWGRKESKLAQKYKIEVDRKVTAGNGIDKIRLNGLNNGSYSQHINENIKKIIKLQRCVVLGTSNPEVDHKNGMKNEDRVMKNELQKLTDFQPLSKAANDAKRQFCKECRASKKRYDAKKLGYPISFYSGVEKHNDEENACYGCYWYDPLEFKKHLQAKE